MELAILFIQRRKDIGVEEVGGGGGGESCKGLGKENIQGDRVRDRGLHSIVWEG